MEPALIISTLVGLGCLVMGFILLSQEIHKESKSEESKSEESKSEESTQSRLRNMDPIMTRKDFIWMQDTREPVQQLRPYPTFA